MAPERVEYRVGEVPHEVTVPFGVRRFNQLQGALTIAKGQIGM